MSESNLPKAVPRAEKEVDPDLLLQVANLSRAIAQGSISGRVELGRVLGEVLTRGTR